jgi:predicted dienelactone hydrolase
MTANCSRRRLLQAGTALGFFAAARPSRAAGSVVDETWRDHARQRDLPVRIRWPAAAGELPLVLHSHGLGGSREGGDVWGRAWCDAGFVVVHLQHPGSDTEVLRAGLPALRAAGNAEQLIARAADVRFALDEIGRRRSAAASDAAGAPAWRDLRADAMGLAGHSLGAQTTQAVAGQRYPVPADLADPRPKAFIALSPSTQRSNMPVQDQFGGIRRPFLAITGSLDGDPFGAYKGGDQRARIFEGLPPGERALLWLEGADHNTFAGNGERRIVGRGPFLRDPAVFALEPAHHALVARISTLWWRAQLLGDADAKAALSRPAGLQSGDRWQLG